jgi:hypothetical protein
MVDEVQGRLPLLLLALPPDRRSHSSVLSFVMPPPVTSTELAPKREEEKPEQVDTNNPAPLSSDKLERRIKSIRVEYLEESSNIEELMVSMDELSGTPEKFGRMFTCYRVYLKRRRKTLFRQRKTGIG